MMVEPDETAGGCGGSGTGLPEPRSNTRRKGVSDRIAPRKRVDTPSIEPIRCLLISGIVIESSRRPTAVVGMRPSGKSRLNAPHVPIIVGQLGEFLKDNEGFKYFEIVNDALRQACRELPRMAFVSSADLTDKDRNDNLHMDMESLCVFGRRYAEEFLQLCVEAPRPHGG